MEDAPAAPTVPDHKRRRSETSDDLEIDINLPEPPSKKAKRLEKKKKSSTKNDTDDATTAPSTTPASIKPHATKDDLSDLLPQPSSDVPQPAHGIWIGNLPFTATRTDLLNFFSSQGSISEPEITRLHLPGPTKKSGPKGREQQNRGFAYVDFATAALAEKAIALSEKLLQGRRVLIKDSKNFEGRPEKTAEEMEGVEGGKEVSKRVWIGNLGFDVTKEDIWELYKPAGEVEDVFLATFEDTGKCKGFGWVRFGEVSGAEAAVRGFLYKENVAGVGEREDEGDSDSEEMEAKTEKKAKKEKVWVNRIHGRTLKCEFAEDAQTRYKKRYGSGKDGAKAPGGGDRREPQRREHRPSTSAGAADGNTDEFGRTKRSADAPHPAEVLRTHKSKPDRDGKSRPDGEENSKTSRDGEKKSKPKQTADERSNERRKRHDARTVAPGKALATTQRATGAIVAGKGTKVTFD